MNHELFLILMSHSYKTRLYRDLNSLLKASQRNVNENETGSLQNYKQNRSFRFL